MGLMQRFRDGFTWGRAGSIVFFSLFILMFLAYSGNNSNLEKTQEELSQAERQLEEARTGSLTVVDAEIISPKPVVANMKDEADGEVKEYHVKLVNAGEGGSVKISYSFLSANRTVLVIQNQTEHMSAGEEKTVTLRYSSPEDSETWHVSTSSVNADEFRAEIVNTDERNEVNVTLKFFDSGQDLLEQYSKIENIPTDNYEEASFYVEPPKNFESYKIGADYVD